MRSPFSYMKGRGQAQAVPAIPEAPKQKRSVREALTDVFGNDAFDKASSPSTQMSLALGQKPVAPTGGPLMSRTEVAEILATAAAIVFCAGFPIAIFLIGTSR